MSEPDDRRYTYGGHVAHLLPFTSTGNYAPARCGYAPSWPAEWLGSGSQDEQDEAERLAVCKRCERMAAAKEAHREAVRPYTAPATRAYAMSGRVDLTLRQLVESGLTYAEAEAALSNVTSLPPVPWGPKGPAVEDTAAFVGTCDMGGCSNLTKALVLTDDGWLSACRRCAGRWATSASGE